MKTNLKVDGVMVLTGAAILAAVVVAYFVKKKGGAVVDKVIDSINPASDKNIVYSTVNAAGEMSTGQKDWSLGSALYDWTHADYDPNSVTSYKSGFDISKTYDSIYGGNLGYFMPFGLVAKSVEKTGDLIDWVKGEIYPNVSPWYAGYQMEDWEIENPFGTAPAPKTPYSNPISEGVNYLGEKVTGQKDWTLGGWVYDITH